MDGVSPFAHYKRSNMVISKVEQFSQERKQFSSSRHLLHCIVLLVESSGHVNDQNLQTQHIYNVQDTDQHNCTDNSSKWSKLKADQTKQFLAGAGLYTNWTSSFRKKTPKNPLTDNLVQYAQIQVLISSNKFSVLYQTGLSTSASGSQQSTYHFASPDNHTQSYF